jgi:hypothetical protein
MMQDRVDPAGLGRGDQRSCHTSGKDEERGSGKSLWKA